MRYHIGIWSSVFAVPSELVDRHLKLAGKEQLKVILWILRHSDRDFELQQVSLETGVPLDNVEDALDYWVNSSFLTLQDGELSNRLIINDQVNATLEVTVPSTSSEPICPTDSSNSLAPARTATLSSTSTLSSTPSIPLKKIRMIKPNSLHIAKRLSESEEIKYLMQETEMTLGKTVSPALSSTLVLLHDDYGLPVEILTMIIHYAKSIGRTGTSYIESVARDWAESEIFSVDAAELKLTELTNRKMAWKKVASAAGLNARAGTKKEEDFSYRWVYDWNMQSDMISVAYERCADSIGGFSMPYMNRILEKWHKSGILTTKDIIAIEKTKPKNSNTQSKSYDINEFEEMSYFDPPPED